jgi:hypothetical protein
MTQIWDDPDVTTPDNKIPHPNSLTDRLSLDQILEMAKLLGQLHDRFVKDDTKPVDWPEWQSFMRMSYDLGFVCRDASDQMDDGTSTGDFINAMIADRTMMNALSLRQMRQVIHYIVRSERHGDGGGDRGAGTLYKFVESGLADAFAGRLNGNP